MEDQKNRELRRFARFFLFNFMLCVVAYLLLISNELANTYDGLWNGAQYRNYSWVVMIGRWFWPIVGKAQMNVCPEPFTSVLALCFYVLGACIAAFWFRLKDSFHGYLLVLTATINTAVCVSLTYRYTSPTFGLSFLLSVVAAWALSRDKILAWLCSVLCLILALALYQSNIGCASVLVLLYVIRMFQNGEETKKVFRFIWKTLAALICACILYKIIWDLSMKLWHVEAAGYLGAGDVSVMKILTSFPRSFLKTYRGLFEYFFENNLKHNVYQRLLPFRVMIVCLAVVTVILVGKKLTQRPLSAKLGAAACLLLLPPAANVALLLAADAETVMIQMTLPMAVVFPFLLCVTDSVSLFNRDGESRLLRMTAGIRALCMLVLLCGSFMMVSIDQHVMLKSRENAVNMLNRVAVDLGEDTNPEGGVFFIGRPSDNPNFLKDQLWDRSNNYAHYGEFWLGGNLSTQSYFGYLRDAGLNLTFNWNEDAWREIGQREDIKAMPLYPDDGYIMRAGNAMVVRFS